MRIKLDNGVRELDIEENIVTYDSDTTFLGLLRDALVAMGYTEAQLLNLWNKKDV